MRIVPVSDLTLNNLTIIVYGPSGSGKTTLAKTLPGRSIYIDAEGGSRSISKAPNIDAVSLSTDDNGNPVPKEMRVKRFGEVYRYLLTDECKSKYQNVFIDSFTEISQNMVEQLQAEFPDRKDSLVLYGENAKRMRAMTKLIRDLPGYTKVLTALSEVDKDENGKRFTGISLVGKMSAQIPAFVDEVFYLYVGTDDDGNQFRKLVTQPTDSLVCKDRSGNLDKYEEPNLTKILEKILS